MERVKWCAGNPEERPFAMTSCSLGKSIGFGWFKTEMGCKNPRSLTYKCGVEYRP